MLLTCCLLAADGVLQISGKRKSASGRMEDKENGKTPAQLKDELSGLKMRALQTAVATRRLHAYLQKLCSIQLSIISLPYIVLN